MNRRVRRASLLLALTVAACLDPLYEDGAPLTSGWVLCCASGAVSTCFCDDATSCQRGLFACAGGRCSVTPVCSAGTGGGSGTGGSGGASGGGTGLSDAGAAGGGGGTTLDAGTVTGGGAGGGGGGGGISPSFEFCCFEARVSTCTCPASGCNAAPFTPCPGGACIAGTSSAICR